jgi:hypothetical protein
MRRSITILRLVVGIGTAISMISSAMAAELDGAWITDRGMCDKVFLKKGGKLSFTPKSDLYGNGFILEGNAIRGKVARCAVKSRQQDRDVVHLMAGCATDIMLSNIQFTLKVLDDDTISRLFPGMEGMDIPYYRCRF